MPNNNNKNYPVCSFCGRTEQEVDHLIAGNGVFICDECIEVCSEIIEDELEDFDDSSEINLLKPKEKYKTLCQ